MTATKVSTDARTEHATVNVASGTSGSFPFEALRALGYTPYGSADIGEVLSTAGRIPDGDEGAWYTQWLALAERVHADADASAAAGHHVSAREPYLRASNYYRLCEFYLRVEPADDVRVREVASSPSTRSPALRA